MRIPVTNFSPENVDQIRIGPGDEQICKLCGRLHQRTEPIDCNAAIAVLPISTIRVPGLIVR